MATRNFKIEVFGNIAVKAYAFVINLGFIALIASQAAWALELAALQAAFFFARGFDFSIGYLRRLLWMNHERLNIFQIVIVHSLRTLAVLIIFTTVFKFSLLESTLLALACLLFTEAYVYLNNNQKSHLINLVHPTALLSVFILERLQIADSPIIYLLVSCIGLGVHIFRPSSNRNVKTVDLQKVYNIRVGAQFMMTMSYLAYSQLTIVIWSSYISSEDFALINTGMRMEALLVGAASILATALWNENGRKISRADGILLNFRPYAAVTLVCSFISMAIFLNNSLGSYFLLSIWLSILPLSIYTYFVSQIFLRLQETLILLWVSLFEGLVSISVLLSFKDIYIFSISILIVSIVKANFLWRKANDIGIA